MEKEYVMNEFPSITDQKVLSYFFLLQNQLNSLNELIGNISTCTITNKTTLGLVIPILSRIEECSQSIAILLSKNRVRDASILILNLYELRLDILYIALDSTRENIWMEHNNKSSKPWKVYAQLRQIFSNHDELSAEKNLYRNFSMVKHGNAAGKQTSFKIAFVPGGLLFSSDIPEQIIGHIHALGGLLQSSFQGAFQILVKYGISFPEIKIIGLSILSAKQK